MTNFSRKKNFFFDYFKQPYLPKQWPIWAAIGTKRCRICSSFQKWHKIGENFQPFRRYRCLKRLRYLNPAMTYIYTSSALKGLSRVVDRTSRKGNSFSKVYHFWVFGQNWGSPWCPYLLKFSVMEEIMKKNEKTR